MDKPIGNQNFLPKIKLLLAALSLSVLALGGNKILGAKADDKNANKQILPNLNSEQTQESQPQAQTENNQAINNSSAPAVSAAAVVATVSRAEQTLIATTTVSTSPANLLPKPVIRVGDDGGDGYDEYDR